MSFIFKLGLGDVEIHYLDLSFIKHRDLELNCNLINSYFTVRSFLETITLLKFCQITIIIMYRLLLKTNYPNRVFFNANLMKEK